MKRIFYSKYSLLISFLLFAAGSASVFFYLWRTERVFSLETTLQENFKLKVIIVSTGVLSAMFNMAGVYASFSAGMNFLRVVRMLLLNFPLLVLELIFVYAFFVLNAYL